MQLFDDERADTPNITVLGTAPSTTKEKILYAVKNAKLNKTVGPDPIPVEFVKLINDGNIDLLLNLFNAIYITGNYLKK